MNNMIEKEFNELKILPPRMDFVFKRLFGDERNKDILSAFLKAVLGLPDEDFKELQLLNTELKKEYVEDKYGILDVKVITANGTQIDIEIQLHNKADMIARSLYYWSKLYTEQAQEGDGYATLCRTIAINILDFNIFPSEKYHSTYLLQEKESKELLTDLMQIDFLELEKVRHVIPSNHDEKLEWAMFVASDDEEVFSMLAKKNEGIDKAYNVLKTLSSDPETRALYLAREKAVRDYSASIIFAKNEALAEGLAEGERKANIETAQRMLGKGLPIDIVMEITQLSADDIKKLN